jgi:hypothetical protein
MLMRGKPLLAVAVAAVDLEPLLVMAAMVAQA